MLCSTEYTHDYSYHRETVNGPQTTNIDHITAASDLIAHISEVDCIRLIITEHSLLKFKVNHDVDNGYEKEPKIRQERTISS